MLSEKQKYIDLLFEEIAKQISITEAMIDKAEASYESVGKWLGDGLRYDLVVTPQGSMNLGTTIKPTSDEDDYDIDLVAIMKNGQSLTAGQIKTIIGNRLKENHLYAEKIAAEGEGKRCWKMQYDEFHMDILPCVPVSIYLEPNITSIRLTHKNEEGFYEDRYSDPYKFRQWFESRMQVVLDRKKKDYSVRNNVELHKVPTYRVKTPLQMAIQLLKRHRDIMFCKNKDMAPISVIITTLSAHAYNGEESIYEALVSIVTNMHRYIEKREGHYLIPNPARKNENFADKWNENPAIAYAFNNWLKKVRNDVLEEPEKIAGIDSFGDHFRSVFGKAPVNRALKSLGVSTKKAGDSGNLYVNGLTSGLTVSASNGVLVKGHTFYGL